MSLTQSFPKDLNQVAEKVDGLNEMVNQYVVAPIAGFGIAGFKFSAFKQFKGELKATATDYYTETNIALQDNIALEPELFTLSGVVSELNYEFKEDSKLKQMAEKLITISAFIPMISSSMKSLQETINSRNAGAKAFADSALGTAQDLWSTYQKLNPPKTLQAKAYNYFLALRNARVLISFDTPYGFKSKFAIVSLIMTQPEFTEGKSDVEIILKEIRFAKTKATKFDPNTYQSRSKDQNQPTENKGSTQGEADNKTPQQRAGGF